MMPFQTTQTPTTAPPRRFGTQLSANSPPPSSSTLPQTTDKAKRLSLLSQPSPSLHAEGYQTPYTTTPASVPFPTSVGATTYSVTFPPGPIGLQLDTVDEPDREAGNNSNHTRDIRVQKFVDGGPSDPGPARKSGWIHPGDSVVLVNGRPITSYQDAVALLQDTSKTRTLTLRRQRGMSLYHQGPRTTGAKKIAIATNTTLSYPSVGSSPLQQGGKTPSAQSVLFRSPQWHIMQTSTPSLTPSKVKKLSPPTFDTQPPPIVSPLPADQSGTSATSSKVQAADGSSANGSPTLPVLGGSILPASMGEILVGMQSTPIVQQTMRHKFDLLQELERAKATITVTSRDAERNRLQQELDRSRLEKQRAEESLRSLQTSLEMASPLSNQTQPLGHGDDQDSLDDEAHVKLLSLRAAEKEFEIQELTRENEALLDRCLIQTQIQLSENERNLEMALEQVQALEQANQRLQQQLEDHRHAESLVELQSQALSDTVRMKEKKLDDLQVRLNLKDSQFEALEQTIEQFQSEIADLKRREEVWSDQLSESQKRAENEFKLKDETITKQMAEIARLKEEYKRDATQMKTQHAKDLQDKEEMMQSLQENIAALKQDFAHEQEVVHKLSEQNAILEEQAAAMQQEIEKIQALEVSKYQNMQTKLTANLEKCQRELALRDQQLTEAGITINRLQNDTDDMRNTIDIVMAEEEDLRSQLRHVSNELRQVQEESKQLVSSLLQAENENKTLQDNLKEQAVQWESKYNSTKVEYQERCKDLDDIASKLRESNERIESITMEKSQLESMIRADVERDLRNEMQKSLAEKDNQIDDCRLELSECKRQVHSLESSRLIAAREIETLKQTNAEMTTRLVKLRDTIDEKESNLSSKRMELLECAGHLEDARDDLLRTQNELAECRKALESTQTQLAIMNERVAQIVEDSTREKEEVASSLIILQNECADLQVQNADLERLLRSLRRSASESQARYASVQKELLHERENYRELRLSTDKTRLLLDGQIEDLNKRLNDLKEHLRVSSEDLVAAKNTITSLSQELQSVRDQCSQQEGHLQHREELFAREREELEDRIETEKQKGTSLAEKLKSAEIESSRLRKEISNQQCQFDLQLRKYETDARLRAQKQSDWLKLKENEMKRLESSAQGLLEAQGEIARLKDHLQHAQAERDGFLQRIDSMQNENSIELRRLSEAHHAQLQQLLVAKGNVETALKNAESQVEVMHSRLQDVLFELQRSRRDVDSLGKEKTDLYSSLHAAQDEVQELKNELLLVKEERLENSSDSSFGEFSELSRRELKNVCAELQRDLASLERRLSESSEDSARRGKHIDRLVEDLKTLSGEIDKLVEANDLLEKCLQGTQTDRTAAVAACKAAEAKIADYQNDIVRLQEYLKEEQGKSADLAQSFDSMKSKLVEEVEKHHSEKLNYENRICDLESRLCTEATEKEALTVQLNDLRNRSILLEGEKEKLIVNLQNLEQLLQERKDEAKECSNEKDSLISELRNELSSYCEGRQTLIDENESLRTTISSLEVDIQTKNVDLRNKEDLITSLNGSLQKHRQMLQSSEVDQKDSLAKLSSATQAIATQKDTIEVLQHRAVEAERLVSNLTDQIQRLQASLRKVESSSETDSSIRVQTVKEVEEKCMALDHERKGLRETVSKLRDELRQSRQEITEYVRTNKNLVSRIEKLKSAYDSTKTELQKLRSEREQSLSYTKLLGSDMESKQMEIDHLNTKIQVLNATIARLKAGNLLSAVSPSHQEQHQSAESDSTIQQEIVSLKAELHKKTTKLESMSAVYQSQQQILQVTQSLEDKLIRHIEEVTEVAKMAFEEISQQMELHTNTTSSDHFVQALDLANSESLPNEKLKVNSKVNPVKDCLVRATASLQEKVELLNEWKEMRSHRLVPALGTPRAPSKAEVRTPDILDAWLKMKRVLQNEVISPSKVRNPPTVCLDPMYLENVVLSLEGQIDSLLSDLKTANDALRAKDQLFLDLESLVTHHESERDILENKIKVLNSSIEELGASLKRERKQRAELEEKRLASSEANKVGENKTDSTNRYSAKVAGMLISSIFERRVEFSKATAFHQWICQASAMQAVQKHGASALALAQQLETTREKLLILKKHLKRTRRGKEPSLDRILEGYEAS